MDVNNQGLNIPSNLQNLDVRDELLSTEVGSGSACAYSLRDLTGNNLNCVRVRREPEDTTDAIDNEKIFSAQAVASGELEDWVNGKLETTLPLDVATGSAGYSLRKIKSNYNDNAVRIRRISDGVEVEVAFDSDDKVSASSPITDGGTELTPNPDADLGSTSATTLGGFLTESATYFDTTGASSNTVQGLALVAGDNIGTVTFNASDGFGGDASFTFTGYSTSSSFHDNFYWNKSFSATEFLGTASSEKTVTIQAYVKRTNGNVGDSLIFREYGTSNKVTFTDLPLNEWKLVTGSIPTTNAGNNDHIQIGGTNGTIFKLSLVKYSVNLQDAFVHTWYDQAGSNDAVQSTADNQPKIAENGALLADGLTFDGSDDFLQTTSQVLTGTETGANSMYAVIKQTSGDAGYICGSASNPSGSDQVGQSLYSASSNDKIVLTNGNDATATGTLDTITRIEGSNYLVSSNYSNNNTDTLHSNSSATGYANGSSAYDFNAGDRFTIGARKDSTSSSAVLFDGSMKEIIAYDSDQTDNRFKIESNINNYYGFYNDENETSDSAFQFQDERSSGVSVADGVNGFTLDTQTAAAFAGIQLNRKVTSGDSIFVSCNITTLTAGSATASPRCQLRKGTLGGTDGSNFVDLTLGFNSFTLTSTDSDVEFVSFSEGDDNTIFTLTDFKVSRIARNGFVETLYDQSSNGNDVDQITATKQPAIVKNGGIVKVGDEASIRFDGTNDFLEKATYSQGTLSQPNTTFAVAKLRVFVDDNQKIFDGHDGSGRNMLNMSTNGNGQFAAFAGTVVATGEDADAKQNLFTVKYAGSNSRLIINGVTKTTSTMGTDGMIGLTIGANHDHAQNFWDGDIQEVIIFNSDIFDDRSNIQDDVNNYYTIYS